MDAAAGATKVTSKDDALAPCPFCGGKAEEIYIEEDGPNFGGSCICCKACGASSPVAFDRKENLHDSWNKRTIARPIIERKALERAANAVAQMSMSEFFGRDGTRAQDNAADAILALITRDEEEKS